MGTRMTIQPDDTMATDEMLEGYRDGRDLTSPDPSANRSAQYRHGFANGRDDRANRPRASADAIRQMAKDAIAHDETR